MKDIVILGSHGFAKEVLWLLEEINEDHIQWNILGFIDFNVGSEPLPGYTVIGDDEWLLQYPHPICAVCGFGAPSLREKVAQKYRGTQVSFPSVVSRHAMVSNYATLGEGCVVCPGTIINPSVIFKSFVMINMNCTIGHDTVIGDFVTLSPGSHVSGNVQIGKSSEIGSGAFILQGKQLGEETIIGAGSIIIRDIPGHCTVVGNPGRILKR